MLKQTSPSFRTLFLLQFTKELIKNSKPRNFPVKNFKSFPENKIPRQLNQKGIFRRTLETPSQILKPSHSRPIIQKSQTANSSGLYIPEPKLPPNLKDIAPSPTNVDMDLEKLNPLVRDSAVKVIECNGPNQALIVRGNMGTKPTNINLNKEEIENVIEKFSKQSKIPVTEGVFKVAVGRLIITAIISEVVSSKFVIKKMVFPLNKFLGGMPNAVGNFPPKNR